jgi:membrane associated rhomboid family serine protease
VWFGEQTLLGLISSTFHVAGGVAYWAHFGGFILGAGIALAYRAFVGERNRKTRDVDAEDASEGFDKKPQDFIELKL